MHLNHPRPPSTADHPALGEVRRRRLFGVRLWLALMFAAMGILSGTSVYLFVSASSESAAEERSADIAVGETVQLRQNVLDEMQPGEPLTSDSVPKAPLLASRSESFRSWVVDTEGTLVSRDEMLGVKLGEVPGYRRAVRTALGGRPHTETDLPENQIVVAWPLTEGGEMRGALVTLRDRPQEVTQALQALRGERLTALALAVVVAAMVGLLVASLITTRVKRLASATAAIAEGDLDVPVDTGGRDEIGDLGRSFEVMRVALAETFEQLSSERDRLAAVFTSLDEAVMVIGEDGAVRFANPAAGELIDSDGRPIVALRPWVRRATQRGAAESDHVSFGDRVFAVSARSLPAERAALLVVRERTEELRRDEAEREFVSNAAHELRNPIAGMSGAIEVLRSGAKDDPEAREHFLRRLSEDVERVSRLTRALLTLARMEAIGEGEGEVVSLEPAAEEALGVLEVPEGIEFELSIEDGDLAAKADPVMLRQVLIGLLSNAFRHTPAPGAVTLRAQRDGEREVVIEVQDTGIGIPEEDRDRIFERFYRGGGAIERDGFGLGLAIAKRMVDVMGGEISVDSTEGVGSVFQIRLAQAEPSPAPVA